MGIIESAKLAKREINNNQELIEKQFLSYLKGYIEGIK